MVSPMPQDCQLLSQSAHPGVPSLTAGPSALYPRSIPQAQIVRRTEELVEYVVIMKGRGRIKE